MNKYGNGITKFTDIICGNDYQDKTERVWTLWLQQITNTRPNYIVAWRGTKRIINDTGNKNSVNDLIGHPQTLIKNTHR